MTWMFEAATAYLIISSNTEYEAGCKQVHPSTFSTQDPADEEGCYHGSLTTNANSCGGLSKHINGGTWDIMCLVFSTPQQQQPYRRIRM
jgi:hypothetical protein